MWICVLLAASVGVGHGQSDLGVPVCRVLEAVDLVAVV